MFFSVQAESAQCAARLPLPARHVHGGRGPAGGEGVAADVALAAAAERSRRPHHLRSHGARARADQLVRRGLAAQRHVALLRLPRHQGAHHQASPGHARPQPAVASRRRPSAQAHHARTGRRTANATTATATAAAAAKRLLAAGLQVLAAGGQVRHEFDRLAERVAARSVAGGAGQASAALDGRRSLDRRRPARVALSELWRAHHDLHRRTVHPGTGHDRRRRPQVSHPLAPRHRQGQRAPHEEGHQALRVAGESGRLQRPHCRHLLGRREPDRSARDEVLGQLHGRTHDTRRLVQHVALQAVLSARLPQGRAQRTLPHGVQQHARNQGL